MSRRRQLTADALRRGHLVVLPALSSIVQDLAADSVLYVVQNLKAQPFAITMIDVRWISESAFAAPQSIAVKGYALDNITTFPSAEGKMCAAHYANPDLESVSSISTETGMRAYITTGGALMGGVYSPSEFNPPEPEEPPYVLPEPLFFAMGAGSTLPSIYDDALPISAGYPRILNDSAGLILLLHSAIAAPGSGSLFVGLHGLWLPV